ncbi:MAG: SDR family oxidoreductase [Gemmatimonadota bacterium]|nr:SDR family oxidoreductase [Gemmatimonadota bacterium]
MNATMEGRRVLVTGSTKGIGRAVAAALAEAGAYVAVHGRDPSEVEAVAAEMDASASGRAVGVAADLTDPDACAGLVEEVVSALGALNTVVNNAGLGIFKPITELSVEEWRRQVDTNLGGVFYVCRAAMPHLIESGDGFVINVGSLASRHAFGGGTGYNASKFGLLGMTEAMMADVRNLGVRVSMLMPGSVDTGFGGREPSKERGWRLQADDVAAAVLHMLSYPPQAHVSRIEMRPSRPGS